MKYVSPHLRLHKNPRPDMGLRGGGEGKGPATPSKKGAMHEEGEMHGAAGAVEHVTKTHPGETQPHPHTGVHAIHVHHVDGGKYVTHTHHQDGSVDTEHHPDIHSVHDHMQEMFPTAEGDDQQHDQNADNDEYAAGKSMANMSSLGGE